MAYVKELTAMDIFVLRERKPALKWAHSRRNKRDLSFSTYKRTIKLTQHARRYTTVLKEFQILGKLVGITLSPSLVSYQNLNYSVLRIVELLHGSNGSICWWSKRTRLCVASFMWLRLPLMMTRGDNLICREKTVLIDIDLVFLLDTSSAWYRSSN